MGISLRKGRLVSVCLPFRSESFFPESGNGRRCAWVWTAAEVLTVSGRAASVVIIDPSTCARIRVVEVMIDVDLVRMGIAIGVTRY